MNLSDACLFSSTHDFMGELKREYRRLMPTTFRTIWTKGQLRMERHATSWVVNPSQHFIIDGPVLRFFPNLHVIITPSTGRNHIDLNACKAAGVKVYSLLDDRKGMERISASAEFTFMLLMNSLRRLDLGLIEARTRRWREREDRMRGRELQGKKVGLIGFGRIGRKIASFTKPFGARAYFYDPYVEAPKKAGVVKLARLKDVFRRCDIVCVTCQYNPTTHGLITLKELKLLKNEASFINTSRGEVVVEPDLIDFIRQRPDVEVAVDVLTGEASGEHLKSPLLKMADSGRIVLTPHIAGATVESQKKAAQIALNLLRRHMIQRRRIK